MCQPIFLDGKCSKKYWNKIFSITRGSDDLMEDGLANLSIQCGQRVVEKVDLSLLIDQPEESVAYVLIISTSQNNCFFIVPCKSHPLLLPAR